VLTHAGLKAVFTQDNERQTEDNLQHLGFQAYKGDFESDMAKKTAVHPGQDFVSLDVGWLLIWYRRHKISLKRRDLCLSPLRLESGLIQLLIRPEVKFVLRI
jgi:hypothetical protein